MQQVPPYYISGGNPAFRHHAPSLREVPLGAPSTRHPHMPHAQAVSTLWSMTLYPFLSWPREAVPRQRWLPTNAARGGLISSTVHRVFISTTQRRAVLWQAHAPQRSPVNATTQSGATWSAGGVTRTRQRVCRSERHGKERSRNLSTLLPVFFSTRCGCCCCPRHSPIRLRVHPLQTSPEPRRTRLTQQRSGRRAEPARSHKRCRKHRAA